MPKTPILITGCQRSGTTLLNLVLDSHPDMMSIDEDKFDYLSINTYLHAEWFPQFIAFKLPRYAPMLSFIKSIDDLRVIWCIRDPIDVVWSMLKLKIPRGHADGVAWAAHQNCAEKEILNGYWVLSAAVKQALAQDMNKYQTILKKAPKDRNRLESVFLGALCWKIKNELPFQYESENINFHVVKYESLVTETEDILKASLDFVGLSWSGDVLRHHETHDGVSVGNTSNSRPIDNSSVGGGVENFTQEEVALIKQVCGNTAEKWAY